ncbi:MAG: hypothetical protein IPG72_01720 [Ardenticatenales bacterium]|nr:hypothetical protein [Ardenticatenales bacterium]
MGLANFYSSAYYLVALDLLVAAAVTARLVRRWPRAGWAAAAFGVLAIPALVLRPEWFALMDDIEGRSWAVLVIGVALALVVLAAPRDPAWTTTALWLAAPVLFYATLVEAPRTHFHVVFPALSLIAALTIAALWNRINPSPSIGGGVGERSTPGAGAVGRWAPPVAAALAVVAAYSAFYSWMVFVQHDVAYKRGYPDVKVAGAWYPFAELPGSGWFGFPYRAGWKAIGSVDADITGDYDSNEEPAVTAWYTRGKPRCGEAPALAVRRGRRPGSPARSRPDAGEAGCAPSAATLGHRDRFGLAPTKVGAVAGSGTRGGSPVLARSANPPHRMPARRMVCSHRRLRGLPRCVRAKFDRELTGPALRCRLAARRSAAHRR